MTLLSGQKGVLEPTFPFTGSSGLRKKKHLSTRILSTSRALYSLWCPFWGQKGRYRAQKHLFLERKAIIFNKLARPDPNSHDAIVYSEKAKRIKQIYPFVRFGLLLAGMSSVPGRVLRLEDNFDFMLVVNNPPSPDELNGLRSLFNDELQASNDLADILFHKKKVKSLRKVLNVAY